MKDISEEKAKPLKISFFKRGLIYLGFGLAILNVVMGVSHHIFRIYSKLGLYRMDPGRLVGTFFFVLFVTYWYFWPIPFSASIGINLYGCRKKQVLSVIGIILSLVGIFALMISYVSLGGQLPD